MNSIGNQNNVQWDNGVPEINEVAGLEKQHPLWENQAVCQKDKYSVTIWLSNPNPREMKTRVHIETCTLKSIAASFITAPKRKQPKCLCTDD